MPVVSIVFGLLLSALGGWAYVASDSASKTALIPCIPGIVLIICGALALNEKFLKHAMHTAALFGVLGFLGGAVNAVRALIAGKQISDFAVIVSIGMALLCGVFTALCVKSFIDVRRAKARAAASA